jgi:aquaporin Z
MEAIMTRKLAAEFIGTFWLVFGGCGAAVIAAGFPEVGIGFVGVALAFGLTVLTMAYAVGGISGAHFNPAVTLGLAVAGRITWAEVIPYWIAQVIGGLIAAALLYVVVANSADFTGVGGFASNGFGVNSPGGYGMVAALIVEIVLTGFFLIVILGSTSTAAPQPPKTSQNVPKNSAASLRVMIASIAKREGKSIEPRRAAIAGRVENSQVFEWFG